MCADKLKTCGTQPFIQWDHGARRVYCLRKHERYCYTFPANALFGYFIITFNHLNRNKQQQKRVFGDTFIAKITEAYGHRLLALLLACLFWMYRFSCSHSSRFLTHQHLTCNTLEEHVVTLQCGGTSRFMYVLKNRVENKRRVTSDAVVKTNSWNNFL